MTAKQTINKHKQMIAPTNVTVIILLLSTVQSHFVINFSREVGSQNLAAPGNVPLIQT